MKKLFVLALLLASSASALAGDNEPSKFTVEQVLQINAGLSQLNCGNKTIKDGAKETQICEAYKWSPGLTWMIATDQRKTLEIAAQYNKGRNQALASLVRKADGNPTEEAAAKFAVADRDALDVKFEIALDHFKRADLEPMNLPPSVITALLPIIDP
jgi:hypothetical protein